MLTDRMTIEMRSIVVMPAVIAALVMAAISAGATTVQERSGSPREPFSPFQITAMR